MIDKIVLGTARWGSVVNERESQKLLDSFVESGGRYIDTATNYPINGDPQSVGLAIRMLGDWLRKNPGLDLNVMVKMGSIDNSGGPETNLSPSALRRQFNAVELVLQDSLGGVGVHWDNRTNGLEVQIHETVSLFKEFHNSGLRICLSGIADKRAYKDAAPNLAEAWEIQVKETRSISEVRDAYAKHFPAATYMAYGISSDWGLLGGKEGLSNSRENNTNKGPVRQEMYRETISWLLNGKKVSKIIIGPRILSQLNSVISSAI